ncbi:hypothetical protein H312_03638 [Anncaliia algerae PRA339]|uniref:Uncharacterized protein n=1 Tax=Anncaliia algerae PRA339 TaxID=1288291 RepID=A0A059EW46_9MICR|nr:hypothetical protein H312_03638 [Anncaliia algerae PRA339]
MIKTSYKNVKNLARKINENIKIKFLDLKNN